MVRLGRPPLLRRSEITLQMPRVSPPEVAIYGVRTQETGDHRDSELIQRLFIAMIESASLLHEAYQLSSAPPDIEKLEQQIPAFEAKVWVYGQPKMLIKLTVF